ncbi:hypothetical protein ACOSQ3_000277 [Xanthoceras sorbifolium]
MGTREVRASPICGGEGGGLSLPLQLRKQRRLCAPLFVDGENMGGPSLPCWILRRRLLRWVLVKEARVSSDGF